MKNSFHRPLHAGHQPLILKGWRLASFLFLLLLTAAGAQAQPEVTVTLLYHSAKKADGTLELLPLQVTEGQTASFPVLVTTPTVTAEKKAVFIYGALVDTNNVQAGKAELMVGGQSGAAGIALDVSTTTRQGLLTLSWEKNTAVAGKVVLVQGGQGAGEAPVASFDVKKARKLAVVVNGSSAAGGPITLATLSTSFADWKAVTVASASDLPLAGLRVSLSPFSSEQGATRDLLWLVDGMPAPEGPLSFTAKDRVKTFALRGTALRPRQAYTALLTLHHEDGTEDSRKVTVTAAEPAAPLEVLGVAPVRAETGVSGSLVMHLQDPTGAGTTVTSVAVTSLTRADAALPGAAGTQAKVCNTLRDPKACAVCAPTTTTPFALPGAGGLKSLQVDLGPQEPGEYTGTLTVIAENVKPKNVEFKLYVKTPRRWAALCIAFGVLLSALARWYFKFRKPLLLARHNALVLCEDLAALETRLNQELGSLDELEQSILRFLHDRLEGHYRGITSGKVTADEALLTHRNNQLTLLPAWIKARRRVAALPPGLDGTQDFAATVEKARTFLMSDAEAAAGPAFAVIHSELAILDGKIIIALEAHLADTLKQLQQDLEAQRKRLGGAHESALAALLKDAESLSQSDAAVQDKIRQLTALQGRLTLLLAEHLGDQLKETRPPPGFEPASPEWLALLKKARAGLLQAQEHAASDPARAAAAYNDAFRTYLEGATTGLQTAVQKRKETSRPDPETATPEDQQDYEAAFKTMEQLVTDALRLLQEGKLPEAEASYLEAAAAFPNLPKGLGEMGGLDAFDDFFMPSSLFGSLASVIGGESPQAAVSSRNLRTLPDAASVRRKLLWGNVLAALVLGVIAVALGLKALWETDASWGGFNDGVLAVLWGLGLHSFTAYDGLSSIENALVK